MSGGSKSSAMANSKTQLVVMACLLSSGCNGVFQNAFHTLIVEPFQYGAHVDRHVTSQRNFELAQRTWDEMQASAPDQEVSADYEHGFKDGYVDYLDAGGTCEPPPVPPRKYWNDTYRSPGGKQSINDWFAGFRDGATMARDGGYRELVTVPSSLPLTGRTHSLPDPAAHELQKRSPRLEVLPSSPPFEIENGGRPDLSPAADESLPVSRWLYGMKK